MLTSSKKNKGRTLQKLVIQEILTMFPELQPDDVVNTSMGASGEDVKLSPKARRLIPLSIECKNTEKISIWAAYEQACSNAKQYIPTVVFKRNRSEPLVVLNFNSFLWLVSQIKHDEIC